VNPVNAIAELRLTTRVDHDRIERLLRVAEPMSLAHYATMMSGFDSFLRVWEPLVDAALPARLKPWFRARRRGGMAAADVDWLRAVAGEPPRRMNTSAVADLPLEHVAEVFGSLYVIEDSAIGGRVVAPRLHSMLGLSRGRGASFFHGFGGETSAMWGDFRVLAAREIGTSDASMALACEGARRTFAAMSALFEPLVAAPLTLDIDLDLTPTPDCDITQVPVAIALPSVVPGMDLDIELEFGARPPRNGDIDSGHGELSLLR